MTWDSRLASTGGRSAGIWLMPGSRSDRDAAGREATSAWQMMEAVRATEAVLGRTYRRISQGCFRRALQPKGSRRGLSLPAATLMISHVDLYQWVFGLDPDGANSGLCDDQWSVDDYARKSPAYELPARPSARVWC